MTKNGPEYYGRTALYRFYDNTGQLLYVGITSDPESRWRTHETVQFWWTDVARKELVWFPTRAKARAAETRAIRREKPLYDRSDRRGRLTDEELRDRQRESTARAVSTLKHAMEAGELPLGSVLPRNHVLAKRYALSTEAAARAVRDLVEDKLLTHTCDRYVVHDPETFPRDLAYRYGLLYALILQAFGQEPFTCSEVQKRTRLSSAFVYQSLLELRKANMVDAVSRAARAGQRWALRPAPPLPPYEPCVVFDPGLE